MIPLTKLNAHKLMLVSLVTSVKVHEDVRLSNTDFAYLGGTTAPELKRVEVLFLFMLKFDLYIEPQVFNHYSKRLTAYIEQLYVPRLPGSKQGFPFFSKQIKRASLPTTRMCAAIPARISLWSLPVLLSIKKARLAESSTFDSEKGAHKISTKICGTCTLTRWIGGIFGRI